MSGTHGFGRMHSGFEFFGIDVAAFMKILDDRLCMIHIKDFGGIGEKGRPNVDWSGHP